MKKITNEELKTLLEKFEPKYIIQLHIQSRIDLKSKQLDKLIKLKNEVEK